MEEERVKTGVDALIVFLEQRDKVSIKEAAEAIKTPESTVQLWVDFLVEERIIGVEYKFTKPYIFLNKKTRDDDLTNSEDKDISLLTFKEAFFEKAKKDKIPEEKVSQLWKHHLLEAIDKEKDFFVREALNRDLQQTKHLFAKYKQKISRL